MDVLLVIGIFLTGSAMGALLTAIAYSERIRCLRRRISACSVAMQNLLEHTGHHPGGDVGGDLAQLLR
jgi:hypothetical protein